MLLWSLLKPRTQQCLGKPAPKAPFPIKLLLTALLYTFSLKL